ncbi:MAG: hypothetical protein R2824_21805 [Saprospiraceae bacterium]|nr:hypothetical protein [Lewinella sp.]
MNINALPGYLKQWGFWILLTIGPLLMTSGPLSAQRETEKNGFPLIISLFTESVGLPDFHDTFKNLNWGFLVGTEYHYSRDHSQLWLQTINLGYYRHPGWQQRIYLSSELRYRKHFGHLFADSGRGIRR